MRLPRAIDGRNAIQIARQCAREGAILVRTAYKVTREDLGTKGRGDIVTTTDLAVEARIHQIIEAAYPEHGILSEETRNETLADGWVWVVDPVDGTTNFFQGIPFFCINIALCYDGEPVLGLTYDPLQREEFLAVQGKGLRLNGKRMASTDRGLADATVVFDFGSKPDALPPFNALHEMAWEVMHVRVLGSAALSLAYAASGRIDLFVFGGGMPWDLAAGIVLVREGGGAITDIFGGLPNMYKRGVLAGSRQAHAGFLERVEGEPWYKP